MSEVIQIKQLRKRYQTLWTRLFGRTVEALKGIDLSVERGEIFGLLGPNGSGKTTTIKILLGLLYASSGSVRVLDGSPESQAVRARIGFLPEESYFYNFLSGEETLYFFGELFNLPKKILAERAERLLRLVGIYEDRKRPIRQYSKGMMRRIGLAQALINDPELLLLDEPTTGLDPIGIREMKDLILDLKRQGKTVLLCSHLLSDVEDLCERIAILYRGEVKIQGAVRDLLTHRDVTTLSFRNLSEQAQQQLLSAAEASGAQALEHGYSRERLEDYFIRLIKQERADDASRPDNR